MLFESEQSWHLLVGPELSLLMDVDVVLVKVGVVSIFVTKEETNTTIKHGQSILGRIVSEAMPEGMDKEVEVRDPVFVIDKVLLSCQIVFAVSLQVSSITVQSTPSSANVSIEGIVMFPS